MRSTLLWSYSGFDNLGTIAGEVIAPARTYPRAIALAFLLIIVFMSMPLILASLVADEVFFDKFRRLLVLNAFDSLRSRKSGSTARLPKLPLRLVTGLVSLLWAEKHRQLSAAH